MIKFSNKLTGLCTKLDVPVFDGCFQPNRDYANYCHQWCLVISFKRGEQTENRECTFVRVTHWTFIKSDKIVVQFLPESEQYDFSLHHEIVGNYDLYSNHTGEIQLILDEDLDDDVYVDVYWEDSVSFNDRIKLVENLEIENAQLRKDIAVLRELVDRPDGAGAKFGFEECQRVLGI